jgi:hypothetical protein
MDEALILHVATALAKVDDMTPEEYGYPDNTDQGWGYLCEQAEAAINAVATTETGLQMTDTLQRIADILQPIADCDWHGKWRIKKVIELCSSKHPMQGIDDIITPEQQRWNAKCVKEALSTQNLVEIKQAKGTSTIAFGDTTKT